MAQSSLQEVATKYIFQFQFDVDNLDYALVEKHKVALQVLAEVSNSGACIFDLNEKKITFFSSNYGNLLGYTPDEFEYQNYLYFESKIHPEDKHLLALNGLSTLKMFNALSGEEKLNHKVIYEYRIMNASGEYVRFIEQYQILELDKTGQIWLLLSTVDMSPNQIGDNKVKSQFLNFRTGQILPIEIEQKPTLELTKRELEILNFVKQGYLSKEISDKLSISVHTVNTHRQRFLEKLGANNSMEAIIFASKYGLLA
ncbi:LuxR C-terminal-related transcriptional regulator [Lunatibacter salilacus]|uniref:LuxR C-terminal-related transcriptional regulator n=1 Tax=Lunatibacter salilacus TaxID=2483804 RepID=UPI00131EBEC4|nr:LuxR C-terminal-related transcriptional regulator [Lunatibacter salilacus]